MKPSRVTLTVIQGSLKGHQYVFEQQTQVILGRADDCDIQLPREYANVDLSRHHCMFEIDPPAVRVRDLGSRNGTFVNGEKIGQRPAHWPAEEVDSSEFAAYELQDGDQVSLGNTVLRVDVLVAADAPEPVSSPLYFV
jgi:pSer/pThr/pTyr-binding forkhead associated (FHA) protein